VVENGSTDGTVEALARFAARESRIEVVSAGDIGLVAARNLGLSRATAEFVALLDADDVWLPGKLARQMARFESEPEAGAVGSFAWYIGPGGNRMGIFRRGPRNRTDWKRSVDQMRVVSLVASSAVMRRALVEEVGGFDRAVPVAHDLVLFTSLAQLAPVMAIPEPLVCYRIHGSSLSVRNTAVQLSVSRWVRGVLRSRRRREAPKSFAAFQAAEANARCVIRFLRWTRAAEIHCYRMGGLRISEHRVLRGLAFLALAFLASPIRVAFRLARNSVTYLWLRTAGPAGASRGLAS